MTDTFDLKGHYLYDAAPNGRGELTGEINVKKSGTFEGIVYDHASMNPDQKLVGLISLKNTIANLEFLKMPSRANLANLGYSLARCTDGRGAAPIEGTYTGRWGALPYKIGFDESSKMFTASLDMSVCGLGDEASITLSRK